MVLNSTIWESDTIKLAIILGNKFMGHKAIWFASTEQQSGVLWWDNLEIFCAPTE